jgi:orotidine-5'-phosphate decarboxylase
MHFIEKLDSISKHNNSLVCVGLDSDPAKIPPHLLKEENPILAFNKAIIEATSDIAQSYKLNLAFYEALGSIGYETVKKTLEIIPENVLTIGDAKRGDIGNTAAMYAKALFDDFGFDSATVAPYMGIDSVEPFLKHKDKGVFILALTSNPGSRDFQYLESDSAPLYEHVVKKVKGWNSANNCGLVVGATHPEELQSIRNLADDMPILIPGLGAQGGNAELSVQYGTNESGLRALFNSSRGIIYKDKSESFADGARAAALAFRDELNGYRGI